LLHLLRRSRCLVAPFAFAIAAMVVLGTVDWWHAADGNDGPQPFHDHSAHHLVFKTSSAVQTGEHCYLCHWLLSLNSGLRPLGPHQAVAKEARRVHLDASHLANQIIGAGLSARAPPA
jgi:hypothetical protein